jgi:hypothetical protein
VEPVSERQNLPDFIRPGARVEWATWCGTATATITFVDRFRVSTDAPGVWFEATCFKSLADAVKVLRPAVTA